MKDLNRIILSVGETLQKSSGTWDANVRNTLLFFPFLLAPLNSHFPHHKAAKIAQLQYEAYFLFNAFTCDASAMITSCAAQGSFQVSQLCNIAKESAGTEFCMIRLQCGSCESPAAWYHYHHKKSCFWDFQISSLRVGRYSCLKSFKWTACLLDCQGHLEIKKFWRNEKSLWSGRPSKRKERGCLFCQYRPDGAYGATCFVKRGNVILSYIRIQLTVILIFSTFFSKGQTLVLNQQGFSVLT